MLLLSVLFVILYWLSLLRLDLLQLDAFSKQASKGDAKGGFCRHRRLYVDFGKADVPLFDDLQHGDARVAPFDLLFVTLCHLVARDDKVFIDDIDAIDNPLQFVAHGDLMLNTTMRLPPRKASLIRSLIVKYMSRRLRCNPLVAIFKIPVGSRRD
jgi:hypothetical protein